MSIYKFFITCLLVCLCSPAFSQQVVETDVLDNTASQTTESKSITPQLPGQEDDQQKDNASHSVDFNTLLLIILFGGLVIILELIIVAKMKAWWTPYSVIRMLGLTLIIIASIVIVVGQKDSQVTAVIGLLGTLAGYLLGKDSKEQDNLNPVTNGQGGNPEELEQSGELK